MSRYRYSRDTFSQFHLDCVRQYNHYRMWHSGTYQTHRNNIVVPLIFSMVWADIARKVSTSYPGNQIIDVFGYGPEDRPAAEKNRVLLNAQLKDTRMFSKAINILANGDICGAGIAQLAWKYEEKQVTSRDQLVVPITQEAIETIRTENVVTFDGPDVRTWDPLDFFPQPGVPDPEDLDWVVVRYSLDMDTVDMLVEHGIFDESFQRQLQFANSMPRQDRQFESTEDYKDMRHNAESGFPGHGHVTVDKYARVVTFHELWGRVPRELAEAATPEGEEPAVWRVITIANGSMIARNRPIPYWHGRIPFYIYRPLPDPYFIFGPSKAKIIQKYQWSASRLASQKLDTLDLYGDPMFYSNRYANIERRNLITSPGRIIEGDAPANEALLPITPDLRGTQLLYNEVEWLDQQGQKASGIIEDVVSGGLSGQRQTAREFVGRQENVSIRLLLEARIHEETFLEVMVRDQIKLNQQLLDTPREVAMIGGNIHDPLSGEVLPTERVRVNAGDLFIDYDVRALGASQVLPRAIKQQNWALLSQQINANPLNFAMVNHEAFLRETFRLFEVANVDEFLTVPPKQQVAMALMNQMGMLGNAQEPRAQGPAAAGDSTQLSPLGGLDQINATLS